MLHYDGSINKFIVDDKGTLAVIVFGLPTSVHENAATRCLAAIRLLQENLPRLKMSCWVGVTTAKTFCGAVGSRRRMEYTVMGDSVNLAARLMTACGEFASKNDNHVIVAEATKVATVHEIDYHELSPIKVKGKKRLVAIYSPRSWYESKSRARPHSLRRVTHGPSEKFGVQFESHRAKLRVLESIFDRVFTLSETAKGVLPPHVAGATSAPPPPQTDNEGALDVTSCVVRALGGTSAAIDLSQYVPEICKARGVALLQMLPSQSIYDDGVLKATTVCGAWRGPFVRALDMVARAACKDAPLPTSVDDGSVPIFGNGLKGRESTISRVFKNPREEVSALMAMFLRNQAPDRAFFTMQSGDSGRRKSLTPPSLPLNKDSDKRKSTRRSSKLMHESLQEGEENDFEQDTVPLSRNKVVRHSQKVTSLVVEIIWRASQTSPICIMLDNLSQMDDASWAVVERLSRRLPPRPSALHGPPGGAKDAVSQTCYPILLCLLAPLTKDEGLRRAEWLCVKKVAERAGTMVDVLPLESDEALVFAAEVLGLCQAADSDEQRQRAAAHLKKVPGLHAYIAEAGGVRDVLCSMLLDAVDRRAITVNDDEVTVCENLVALSPPQAHAAIALAAIDDALNIHDQLVVRAASVFKRAFTPTLLYSLAPINMEPLHVKELCMKLFRPVSVCTVLSREAIVLSGVTLSKLERRFSSSASVAIGTIHSPQRVTPREASTTKFSNFKNPFCRSLSQIHSWTRK